MRMAICGLGLGLALACGAAQAQTDPEDCATVRMADLGWTDIMLTNATAELLLGALGYQPTQTLLGLDVAYVSLREGDIDIFHGNWRPVQNEQYKPFFDDGSVEVLAQNLTGAKFTLAVPDYVAAGGIDGFEDLDAQRERFGGKIYTIEPGSNQPLLDMVAADRHGMGDWEIAESSEAGMLAQVARMVGKGEWVVFQAWEPHPMNLDYRLTYLSGGDEVFGPDFGAATVHTLSRRGYAQECPNVARLFQNLVYDINYENHGMQRIIAEGMAPMDAAKAQIAAEPARLEAWLAGVTTLDGAPGLPAVKAALGL